MHTHGKLISTLSTLAACAAMLAGCYEESTPPQPQTKAPAPAPQQGPITDQQFSGGGAALGGAKRSATNIVDQAETKSQQVADQADDLADEDQ